MVIQLAPLPAAHMSTETTTTFPADISSPSTHEATDTSRPRELPSLPAADTGRAAWSFLVAATTIEGIVWGLPYSVGILHAYAVRMFPGQESTVTLAATLQNGLLLVGAGLLGP